MLEQAKKTAVNVVIVERRIDEGDTRTAGDNGAGAVVSFTGVVRDNNEDRFVEAIVYECHESLVKAETQRIVAEVAGRHSVRSVSIVYRMGRVEVGAASLLVKITGAHRAGAFAAAGEIVDLIKARVPIWKHELYSDGTSTWL